VTINLTLDVEMNGTTYQYHYETLIKKSIKKYALSSRQGFIFKVF